MQGLLKNWEDGIGGSGSRSEQGAGQVFTFVYVQELNAKSGSEFETLRSFVGDDKTCFES